MRKRTKWGSLIATGLFVFNLVAFPVQAATPEALETYRETVEEVMTEDGQIDGEDRSFLYEKRTELGLTEEEAKEIEEEIRTARRGGAISPGGQNRY